MCGASCPCEAGRPYPAPQSPAVTFSVIHFQPLERCCMTRRLIVCMLADDLIIMTAMPKQVVTVVGKDQDLQCKPRNQCQHGAGCFAMLDSIRILTCLKLHWFRATAQPMTSMALLGRNDCVVAGIASFLSSKVALKHHAQCRDPEPTEVAKQNIKH